MIVERRGNVLTDLVGENTIHYVVHGCNAKGVMASGIAKEVREKFPGAYSAYRSAYEKDRTEFGLQLGTLSEFTPTVPLTTKNGRMFKMPIESVTIVNAITQANYGRDKNVVYVDYEAVSAAFRALNTLIESRHSDCLDRVTVNFPLIGCGLANGNWGIVSDLIEKAMPTLTKHLWVLPANN